VIIDRTVVKSFLYADLVNNKG